MRTAYTYDDIQIVPSYSTIESRSQCDVSTKFTKNWRIGIPIIASPMDTVTEVEMANFMRIHGGVGVLHRFCSIETQCNWVKELGFLTNTSPNDYWRCDRTGRLAPICAAIGVSGDWKERLDALANTRGVHVILIDVAHGNTLLTKNVITYIKENFPTLDVIAGNVCTAEGAVNLAKWGADGIRGLIGGGSLCETRIRTGIGVPNVTAITDMVNVIRELQFSRPLSDHENFILQYDIPVIADGGIKTPGDVCKALSLGASTVMLGSLLAGTQQSPGEIIREGVFPNEREYKRYRGSASIETKMHHGMSASNVEGNSTRIPYKGDATRILNDIIDGLKSSMSYTGSKTLEGFNDLHLYEDSHVIITSNGLVEAHPHLIR